VTSPPNARDWRANSPILRRTSRRKTCRRVARCTIVSACGATTAHSIASITRFTIDPHGYDANNPASCVTASPAPLRQNPPVYLVSVRH
jgi:hypothetical protein